MSLSNQILEHLKSLPESAQTEVLNFVEYLETRCRTRTPADEDAEWAMFSLSSAMSGLDHEESPYSMDDLKEVFS
jgi:hypothetical protein